MEDSARAPRYLDVHFAVGGEPVVRVQDEVVLLAGAHVREQRARVVGAVEESEPL